MGAPSSTCPATPPSQILAGASPVSVRRASPSHQPPGTPTKSGESSNSHWYFLCLRRRPGTGQRYLRWLCSSTSETESLPSDSRGVTAPSHPSCWPTWNEAKQMGKEGRQAGRDSGDWNLRRSCESPLVYAGREVAEPKDTLKPTLGVFLPRWGSLHRISPSSRGYTRSFVNQSDSLATAPQGGRFGTSSTQLWGWQTRARQGTALSTSKQPGVKASSYCLGRKR